MTKKVLVAMSGGVDSSLAAYLLKKDGYDCIGCTMKLYDNEDIGIQKGHTCCSLSDVEDARSVAYKLHMPYYVFNYKDSFKEQIIDRFVNSYIKGLTPNPCIDCNKYMKFDLLYERAKILGCDYIATGHYAIIDNDNGEYKLKKGLDKTKDQSYVLYNLSREQLAHTLFPLGRLSKKEVREIAAENGFINADKPDSQDICFVPDGDYAGFIERYSGTKFKSGKIVDTNGNVLGQHKGIVRYTIGQRKGLGISSDSPLYVTEKDMKSETLTVGYESSLYKKELTADNMNWLIDVKPNQILKCNVMTRYRKREEPATVRVISLNSIKVIFSTPQRAITPGQSVVIYDNDTVLGGGIIK